MSDYCIYEADKKSQIATITFNRPEKLNSATTADWNDLKAKMVRAEDDDDIKVVILKGAGRCFGTGHDVADLGPHHGWGGPKDRRPSIRRRLKFDNQVFWGRRGVAQVILDCTKATVAQVHGYCYGGHHELALSCDITIASEESTFTHPGYRYIGPLGDIVLFMQTMGVKKAKEMMLTGTPLTAKEALDCGLINRMVTADKLEEETKKVAETIAAQPADAIVMGKSFFEAALDAMGVGTGGTLGYITHCFQTNIRYEPGEFNLFAARKEKGLKGAFDEREKHFKDTPLAR